MISILISHYLLLESALLRMNEYSYPQACIQSYSQEQGMVKDPKKLWIVYTIHQLYIYFEEEAGQLKTKKSIPI